jgi:hypothetical protein
VRLVISTLSLTSPGGTQSYCITVARTLERLGHEVTLFAEKLGAFADRAADEGFDVARELSELPPACDAVLANDAITALLLSERYPDTRIVYVVHSASFDPQLPPVTPGVIDAIVVPSDRFMAHTRALALDVPIIRLAQPIDTDWFSPAPPPRLPPQRALLLSNYLDGRRRDALVETWTAAGIECVQVGGSGRMEFDVRPEIAASDIIVGKGRCVLEGMSSGKAVYVFDAFGGDGWVTAENYQAFEADNFAGMATESPIDRAALLSTLERYDADMGWINRELVMTHHSARKHVQDLVDVLRGPAPKTRDRSTNAAATARTVRSAWRMQARASGAGYEASQLHVRLAASQARLEDAEHELEIARALLSSRCARIGIAIGRVAGRFRGH